MWHRESFLPPKKRPLLIDVFLPGYLYCILSGSHNSLYLCGFKFTLEMRSPSSNGKVAYPRSPSWEAPQLGLVPGSLTAPWLSVPIVRSSLTIGSNDYWLTDWMNAPKRIVHIVLQYKNLRWLFGEEGHRPGDTKKSFLYSFNSYYYYYYYKEKIWLFHTSILSKISLSSSGFGNGGYGLQIHVEGQVGEVPHFPQKVLDCRSL